MFKYNDLSCLTDISLMLDSPVHVCFVTNKLTPSCVLSMLRKLDILDLSSSLSLIPTVFSRFLELTWLVLAFSIVANLLLIDNSLELSVVIVPTYCDATFFYSSAAYTFTLDPLVSPASAVISIASINAAAGGATSPSKSGFYGGLSISIVNPGGLKVPNGTTITQD